VRWTGLGGIGKDVGVGSGCDVKISSNPAVETKSFVAIACKVVVKRSFEG
jgi:hypothetical protein